MLSMMKPFSICAFIFLIFMIMCAPADAQQLRVSGYSGWFMSNTDNVSGPQATGKVDRITGAGFSFRTQLHSVPLEFSLGFAQGTESVQQFQNHFGETFQTVDLRYRMIPAEVFFVHRFFDRLELLAGINITTQYRSLLYSGQVFMEDDRLLSFGMGLSARANADLLRFGNDSGALFVSLAARWSEFFIHDEAGRNTDDFTYRHLTLMPRLGLMFEL